MKEQNAKYLSLISNTDRSDKQGTDWWSILDLYPKKEFFLFYSFGLKGLKNFIIKDDRKIIKFYLDLKGSNIDFCIIRIFPE